MEKLAQLLRKNFNRIGYDIHGIHSNPNSFFQLTKSLKHFEVDVTLDVGANTGQFATGLRSAGFRGSIVSFEPLPIAHSALVKAAHNDALWSVHPRCAIGDRIGEIEINIAGNSVSSSLLPMTEAHLSAEANSAYIGIEKAPIFTLDSLSQLYLNNPCRPFLKIDTQGFEWHVLNGARTTLQQLQGIQCELSLVTLYEGQHLWLDMIDRLVNEGFTLWSIQQGFNDLRNGRTLQVDATFFRT